MLAIKHGPIDEQTIQKERLSTLNLPSRRFHKLLRGMELRGLDARTLPGLDDG